MTLPEVNPAVLLMIQILVGVIGVPIINLIKDKLNWKGPKVFWLTTGLSFLLGTIALIIAAGFTVPTSIEEVVYMGGMILAVTQATFWAFKKEEEQP